jgi:hypothetical protein
MKLGKYSMGIGDRFGQQGVPQLQALVQARESGIDITPVWNKSYREHKIVGTDPDTVRVAADEAVSTLKWDAPYFVDADHIRMETLNEFIAASDFYTLDVANFIGMPVPEEDKEIFTKKYSKYIGRLEIPGIDQPFEVNHKFLCRLADMYLSAIKEAEKIYRHVENAKGTGNFITEVSMDESEQPQKPVELFFILGAISDALIPAQTIAPKFVGRFNKGVDYEGDVRQFEREFKHQLAVIAFAVKEFNLAENLKLSIHTGSDKFSIYRPIGEALRCSSAGIHLKTAGTTWLEELIGLAEAEGDGLRIAKEIYCKALQRIDELCLPYSTVIRIDRSKLPRDEEVETWNGRTFAATLRHDLSREEYNPHFRQLLHISFKIAAEMGDRFLSVLKGNKEIISQQVCNNLFERHIQRLFF